MPATGWNVHVDRRAIADAVPLFVPAIPFGFVLGLAVTESAMPAWLGWATSPLIFAGAAQLALLTLAGTASLWAVITAALVINTRHLMYSAALAPTFQHQPRWMRWLGPYFLLDQVFALSTLRAELSPREFRRYYLTVGAFFWFNWMWVVAVGMVVGPVVPESWRLEFAPPIMFLGLVLMGIDRRPAAWAAVVGGLGALVTAGLPDRVGILIGAIAGVAAGTFVDARESVAAEART
jgi:predicted branched-subunit amino acid permease